MGQYKLTVVDIDNKDGNGLEEWRAIVEAHGGIPETYTVRSPSGGRHLYFWIPKEYPAPTSNKTFSPNIDISGENSLVVGEGSTTCAEVDPGGRIKTGAYVAVNAGTPIAVAPDWFVQKIQRENREPSQMRSSEYPAKAHSELVEDSRMALGYIDPGIRRDDWLKIIAALHDLGDAGYALALEWSSRWSRFNRKQFDAEWKSFNGRREVQLSTLFFMPVRTRLMLRR